MKQIRYYTHIATSLAAGILLTEYTEIPLTASFVVGTMVGSLIPDVDEPKSFIGRRSFGIAWLIKKKYGHRGGTHSLIVWLILTGILLTIQQHPLTWGLSAGYFFHILGDFFSTKGVPLFIPFTKKRFKFFVTYRTGGWMEKLILCLAITYITMTCFSVLNHLVEQIIK